MNKQELPLFETLFKEHFGGLTAFAVKYVQDVDEAKEVVHDAFIKLWEKHKGLEPDTNYKSYLYTSVRNRCLNKIRDRKKVVPISEANEELTADSTSTIETKELEREISYALNTLPNKCRKVFELSRVEELKYSEIAERMDISVKTVEAQMSKALRLMREHLADFLMLLFFIFLE
ncbi:RNA polymerase sigma-70 factor [Fulvivirga lutea]|uniref:RNA polymerase sigma-70 factor n=1 Tax=Fulvivirga lutea TaxID=2810512 RepID=A0A974WHM4_9BACT|nr:RNA polymerase sigma-70 factor [Fulvivirga lutea]QSE98059.1 RNA polymerase sigma-70 factor [Fulvivirga lutea]